MSATTARIVVLISGGGSNLQAIIDAISDGTVTADIAAVISNRPDVAGLERARRANIDAVTLDHKAFDSRESYDDALARTIDAYKPDLIILAGFMRILTTGFVQRYLGRMINIHPSLLPKYPGLDTHQRALDAGDLEHGATVHFVIPELDAGPAIVQGRVSTAAATSAGELAQRVLKAEHQIYPLAVKWLVEGEVQYQDGIVSKAGEPLPRQGYQIDYTSNS